MTVSPIFWPIKDLASGETQLTLLIVSTAQSFTVSGTNLTNNITISAPTGFEVYYPHILFRSL